MLETIRSGSRITKLIIYDAMEMKPQLEEILFRAKKDSITVERVTKNNWNPKRIQKNTRESLRLFLIRYIRR